VSEYGGLEVDIKIINLDEVKRALKTFGVDMQNELLNALQPIASEEEKFLKSTSGFRDRTGHLRRSMYVTVLYNPPGIEVGVTSNYAVYVAMGHGSWRGNWWLTYLHSAVPRIIDGFEKAVNRMAVKFNRGGSS
jgi:hypothetical protein